jgi:putative membrane protein
MKFKIKLLLPLSIILLAAGCKDDDSNNNNNDTLNDADRTFMMQAHEANLAEIDAGQAAASKGNAAEVRYFGQTMITEHTMAQSSLDSLAGALSQSLADTLNAEHEALKQKLAGLTGYAFDTTYIGSQIRDHQKVITMFETEIQNGKHEGVKGYANRYLPHIRMHLATADSIKTML